MSILDIFESSNHRNNIAHFAAIVHISAIDGMINEQEKKVIDSFVSVLNITDEEYKKIMKSPTEYSFMPVNDSKKRLHVLYDLFKTIYSDHEIDELERKAITRYAIGLGYPINKAEEVIEKSIDIFSGNINFLSYKYLIDA
mgnify:CR=1 FL=1|tara:strand:+ start:1340 stop:1762 length:423 start_codon:yes stop_codon:yes gene_type:complete